MPNEAGVHLFSLHPSAYQPSWPLNAYEYGSVVHLRWLTFPELEDSVGNAMANNGVPNLDAVAAGAPDGGAPDGVASGQAPVEPSPTGADNPK